MKRILITGASGFIGSTLVEDSLAKGWEVTAAVRPTSDKSSLKDPRIQFVELDFRSEDKMQQQLKTTGRFDYVIHNAGCTKAIDKQGYLDTNTENTKRFVNVLRGGNIVDEKFLFVSSLAALGPEKGNTIISPKTVPHPVTGYGDSKLAAEEYLNSLNDFPWVAIQPTAVYGPRDKELFTFINLVNKGLEFYIGTQSQNLSFIYSKDLTAQMLSALERGKVGRRYIATDGRSYTSEDLGKAVREAIGRKTMKIKVPLSIVGVIANISEQIGKWRNIAPMLNREKMNELGAESWWCDVSETFDDLNFSPQYDLYTGMKEAVQWYKEHGWI